METLMSFGAAELTKPRRRKRIRSRHRRLECLNADLGSLEQREDTENPKSKPEVQSSTISESSLKENLNTAIGTSAKLGGHTEDAKNLNVIAKETKKRKHIPMNKPTLGEILNPQCCKNVEAVTQETGSGTAATDNQASKRQKIDSNPPSGDVLSTCENTQDKELAKEDPGISKVLEAVSVEESQGGHMKDANCESSVKANTNLNVNDVRIENKKPEGPGKFRRPTLGEILNPRYLELLEASDDKSCEISGKSKSQHRLLIKEGSGTADSGGKYFQEVVNNEKCPSTVANAESTIIKSVVCPQVVSSQMDSTTISAEVVKGKKLVVLDVNGLLAAILKQQPKYTRADMFFGKKKRPIYKRPHLENFLHFCFERFNVGIWSSRPMDTLGRLVDFLLGDLKKKLLFLWDASKCTKSTKEFKCTQGTKDLRKIWDNNDPNHSWVKGTFQESNTLLLDDSPGKAELNPEYTGIFPASFKPGKKKDNFLAPGGKLQRYLEGWAAADDGRAYVKQNPFGKRGPS